MKRIVGIIIVLVLCLGLGSVAQAKMMYYSFEGIMASVKDPTGQSPFSVGSNVYMTYGIDFDRPREREWDSGLIFDGPDTYYAYLVGSNAVNWTDNRPDTTEWWTRGGEVLEDGTGYFAEYHHGESSFILDVDGEFDIGDHMVWNYFNDSYEFMISAGVTLTAISEINPYTTTTSPTPIPGAVWLLGTGLMGLLGFKRRKNKVQ